MPTQNNVLRKFLYLSNPEEPTLVTPEVAESEVDPNLGLNKALDTYRKLIEKNVNLNIFSAAFVTSFYFTFLNNSMCSILSNTLSSVKLVHQTCC